MIPSHDPSRISRLRPVWRKLPSLRGKSPRVRGSPIFTSDFFGETPSQKTPDTSLTSVRVAKLGNAFTGQPPPTKSVIYWPRHRAPCHLRGAPLPNEARRVRGPLARCPPSLRESERNIRRTATASAGASKPRPFRRRWTQERPVVYELARTIFDGARVALA